MSAPSAKPEKHKVVGASCSLFWTWELEAPKSSGSILLPYAVMGAGSSRYFESGGSILLPYGIMGAGSSRYFESGGSILLPYEDMGAGSSRYFGFSRM